MIGRAVYWVVFVTLVVLVTSFVLYALGANAATSRTADPGDTVQGRDVWRWREIALSRDRTARRQAATIRRLRHTLRHDGSVYEAITVAAVTYDVSGRTLFRKAACESHLSPHARNRSSGAAGLFQFLPSTWRSTPYGRLSIWSPYANALAAAWMHRVGRGGEWVCG